MSKKEFRYNPKPATISIFRRERYLQMRETEDVSNNAKIFVAFLFRFSLLKETTYRLLIHFSSRLCNVTEIIPSSFYFHPSYQPLTLITLKPRLTLNCQ